MPSNQNLFGVLNVRKPPGVTSRDLVNRIQRLIRPVKCGHAGTLDPMATGVLLVCLGPATRLATMLQEGTKTYVAEFTFGQVSDTDDSTGKIEERQVPEPLPSLQQIEKALQSMTGTVSQVPPDYSAVHVAGQRAYALARQGHALTLTARQIEIHSIRVLKYEWPRLDLEIVCGSGTYIRSIARDLGEQLGCGGLMSRLERTRIGPFSATDGVAVEELTVQNIGQLLCPAVRIVEHLPKFDCQPDDVSSLLCGRTIPCQADQRSWNSPLPSGQTVALTRNRFTELLALAEVTAEGRLQPRTVFLRASQGATAPPCGDSSRGSSDR
jgi:tRNA pseudouridine55 synthase